MLKVQTRHVWQSEMSRDKKYLDMKSWSLLVAVETLNTNFSTLAVVSGTYLIKRMIIKFVWPEGVGFAKRN